MRKCLCGVDKPIGVIFHPSQEQINATWSKEGYFPGMYCTVPVPCYHYHSYNELKDHPFIHGVELIGNRTAEELGLQRTMAPIPLESIRRMWGYMYD